MEISKTKTIPAGLNNYKCSRCKQRYDTYVDHDMKGTKPICDKKNCYDKWNDIKKVKEVLGK